MSACAKRPNRNPYAPHSSEAGRMSACAKEPDRNPYAPTFNLDK